jgi:hypothetical protein
VNKLRTGILLSQKRYALDLLKREGMDKCKPISTPMSATEKIIQEEGIALGEDDQFRYKRTVVVFST